MLQHKDLTTHYGKPEFIKPFPPSADANRIVPAAESKITSNTMDSLYYNPSCSHGEGYGNNRSHRNSTDCRRNAAIGANIVENPDLSSEKRSNTVSPYPEATLSSIAPPGQHSFPTIAQPLQAAPMQVCSELTPG